MTTCVSAAVRLAVTIIAPVVVPALVAEAQPATGSFGELPRLLVNGNIVYVTDLAGERVKGKVRDLSDSSLTVETFGMFGVERKWPADQIARVSRLDSRKNGFVLGFLAGVVPGVLLGSVYNEYCKNESPDYCPGAIVYAGAGLGLVGGWIGFAIDNAIDGETPLFARPAPSTSRFRLGPSFQKTGAGLSLSVSF